MVAAVEAAKVHWNCSIGPDVNYRCFETIALGTCLVTNRIEEMELLGFRDGVNCFMYSSYDECVSKIREALSIERWAEVSAAGLELAKQHTYTQRCQTLLAQLDL